MSGKLKLYLGDIMKIRNLLLLLISLLLLPVWSYAAPDDDLTELKEKIPGLLGANNIGNEFWLTVPPGYCENGNSDDNIMIYISSQSKTLVTVETATGYYERKIIMPNEVAEFELTPQKACPWVKSALYVSPSEKIYKQAGIHIYSEELITVSVLYGSHSPCDSYLALPVSALGREYITTTYNGIKDGVNIMPCLTSCVAPYDNTTVTFTAGGNSLTKTSGGLKCGEAITKTLNRGDVLIFAADGNASDLTGSRWVASKPIAVVSGNYCAQVPMGNSPSNYLVEMDFPTDTWGADYPVASFPCRKYSPLIRVVSKESNTKIFRNGVHIATLTESGGMENKGWLEMRLLPMAQEPEPAMISGDKPISVSVLNTGGNEDGLDSYTVKPFMCRQVPVQQYQKDIIFAKPEALGESSLIENYINLVYVTDKNGMIPEDLEIAQSVCGEIKWEKVSAKYPGSDKFFPSFVNGRKYAVKKIPITGSGLYKIKASTPFTVYMYSTSGTGGYGHPAGAGLKNLSLTDTIQPIPVYMFCRCFGHTHYAKVQDFPENPATCSNMALIQFHHESSYNFKFTQIPFISGMDRNADWSLEVTDINKNGRAVISFADRAGNDTTIVINYSVFIPKVFPESMNFGIIEPDTSKTMEFKVKNENEERNLNINEIYFKRIHNGFRLDNIKLPLTLKPLEEKSFKVVFTASEPGEYTDSLGLCDTNFCKFLIELNAKVGNPIIEASDINFNTVYCGKVYEKDFTVWNNGETDLRINGICYNLNEDFVINLPEVDWSNPIIIHPNESMNFTINYKPKKEGFLQGSIVFNSNAGENTDNKVNINALAIMPNGIENNTNYNHELTLTPVPVVYEASVNIFVSNECEAKLSVYSVAGLKVIPDKNYIFNMGDNKVSIDMGNLPVGIYYLNVTYSCNSDTIKFCISR